ncbi:MFS transporter [Pseudochrobactrum kiredjianiae]|uniref:MFS transporter n=1 Tax=Pseudochrobactrum kiredjianiae TaxID=386305 RepID=A0ABW3V109_9HYPH|nr:MFS transporter [Pseudochrobactrum kiredjianiae]MDM7853149.1 MFS transporter [Pseudochrobactrum kiredjianiae]
MSQLEAKTQPSAISTEPAIWSILAIAVGTQAAGSIVSQGIYILVPFWREAFGITLASASLAVTVMNGVQIVTMYSFGRAIDTYGERKVVGLAMLGMALSMAGAALFANNLMTLLICMALLGGTYSAVQPGGTRAIMRWFPPNRRGIATGFRQAAVPFGTMIAAAVLPFFAVQYGWHMAAWIGAGVSLFGAVLFWGLYREGDKVASKSAAPLPLKILIHTVGKEANFWPVLRLGIAMSAFQFTFTAHVISYLVDHFGLSIVVAASVFAATQLAGIPGRVLLPWLSDYYRPSHRMHTLGIVSLIAAAAAMLLAILPAHTSLPIVLGVLSLLGFFGIGWFPLYLLEIAEAAPKSSIASTVAFASTLCLGVMALGPYIFGLIAGNFGYKFAWAALIIPVLLTGWQLAFNRRRRL